MDPVGTSVVEWSAAARPKHGETESGDGCLVKVIPCGALVAVVDGLGHGPDAAVAARTALAIIAERAPDPLVSIAHRCHERLHGARGVVMSAAVFDAQSDSLAWLGIGNVAGYVLRSGGSAPGHCETLLVRGGVLGHRLPPLAPSVVKIDPGDMLIVATDGIRWRPPDGSIRLEAPQRMAQRLMDEHAAADDDALVVVLRYLGRGKWAGSPA
jgi:phosphoserine phosphatase RsbX